MTGQERINKIIETIENGHTVQFTTYLKSYIVDSKTLNNFKKAGYDLFKTNKNHDVLMLSGKKYVCMNGCKITFS